MLEVRALSASYGKARVLFDVALDVREREVVALLGRNGAGKSTTLKCIVGLLATRRGEIRLDGLRIDRLAPYRIARLGLGYVPEDRRIFTDLSVLENLEVARQSRREGAAHWTPDRVFALFPDLARMRRRLGAHMSGGEQKMLAIARTLMGNPRVVLLDEPSEGLAPLLVEQMALALRELKREGLSVLLCEQNLRLLRSIADRACVLESGHLRLAGPIEDIAPAYSVP
jgi:branched-chain amino acid transport system ATP-binding protein